MSTIVTVIVREDSADFHGETARINVHGNGDPDQFTAAAVIAMRLAGLNLPNVARRHAGVIEPVVPAI